MDTSNNQKVIDDICTYCEEKKIKDVMKEYMKRIVLEKPDDPVKFLIKSIQENPFPIPSPTDES